MTCDTCRGRGTLFADGAPFVCPDCSGNGHTNRQKAKHLDKKIKVTGKVWDSICEAAQYRQQEPNAWIIDALASTAQTQIEKHKQERRNIPHVAVPRKRVNKLP